MHDESMSGTLPLPPHRPGGYNVVIITLDQHAAGPAARALPRLQHDFPDIHVSVHAAAEWSENPAKLAAAKAAVLNANIVVANLLFIDEHLQMIVPEMQAVRDTLDAFVGMVADPQVVRLTKMGDLDMTKPASGPMALLKKLRGKNEPGAGSAEKQMSMLRTIPKMLKFIPGKAQDLRAWFLCMQYWLGGSEDNIESMVRYLVGRYADNRDWRGIKAAAPIDYPEVGLYHPDMPGRITTDPSKLPQPANPVATIGLLMLRSYILAKDTAHYDAVIRELQAHGVAVLPAFAGGLDGRPAIEEFLHGKIDTLLSLSGFSLVGGPAYNDSDAAVETLKALDVPYVTAQPLEFQTLGQWRASGGGLGPVETTMLIALPEIDGATNPTVFAGRHDPAGCVTCARGCKPDPEAESHAMAPCPERIETLVDKVVRMAKLRRSKVAERKVGIVLYGFPPNAGAAGTAAYLSVFESLFNVMHAMKASGYQMGELPESVQELRDAVLCGPNTTHGQPAQIAARIPAAEFVARTKWLKDIEAAWGSTPGKHQTDGRDVFVLGRQFGNVFVGLQPVFGYEGDPMRLLFEKGFAPTHAFAAFYRWLREDFAADTLLHFGMHGALEFMPGKQAGMCEACWPDRLIGNLPNVYLYAANNPSEATLAKRRSNAVIVSHLTPPLAQSGLYKGLAEIKESLGLFAHQRLQILAFGRVGGQGAQTAKGVNMDASDLSTLWEKLLETEGALITEGLHVVGRPMTAEARAEMLDLMPENADRARADKLLQEEHEIAGLLRALDGRYVPPVPGGDLVRSPEILPTGRNIHAFDPFRMPTAFAIRDGAAQAARLLATHPTLPRSIALVLWGSDNIKSDGGPIGQALALMGARPRFDTYGRLAGAELIPLSELGRPRIDVVMTLSGIFRDLLPLQTKLLAEAAYLCASAENEPLAQNFIRANVLATMQDTGMDFETASLRVFSNAEGAYGSNVNTLVGSAGFGDEDELADAYESRKSFAYGRDGKSTKQVNLLQNVLSKVDLAYQNLESVELGVTTVDHYFDTLGGIARATKRAQGGKETPVYIGDQTRGAGTVRTLQDQIALETRARSLNPKFYEGLLKHGAEGVRQIEAQVTNTLGWSATTGQVEPWVYQRLSETFVLDDEMRERLASLNSAASSRMAQRLLEASDRNYWQPDAATLAALQAAADELEDRMEGVAAE